MDVEKMALLQSRIRDLPLYLQDEGACLEQLVSDLGIPEPHFAVQQAWALTDQFTKWIVSQRIDDTNKMKILARTAFFLGTYLVQKYSCAWVVMKDEHNPAFGRYVVLTKDSRAGKSLAVDVFAIAKDIVTSSDPGHSFVGNIAHFDRDMGAFLRPDYN